MKKNHPPSTPDEARELVDSLTFEQPPTPDQAEALLGTLPPPDADVMVVRSLRVPIEVDDAITTAAKAAGIPKSTWIRQAIETALALQDDDQPISRADALRALTLLRTVHRAA